MKLHVAATFVILGLITTLLPVAIRAGRAAGSRVGPADTYFVTQTSLGTPFQVDSGRLAETKGDYPSHSELRAADREFTHHRGQCTNGESEEQGANAAPTLLKAAYSTMVSTLQRESGQKLDADYVGGQVNYQRANGALYQYEIATGTDPI
jgi:putative membrane protein